MLNSDTKRHIDAARDVLVGVAPNPTTQIDQITYALIYKFMDDMDQAAIKQGGEPSFFTGDLEQFAWSKLMDARMGNQEKMNQYGEALVKFSEAKQLPELFRTIFRSAFLPYRSPETLGLFLKEISFFDYTHPEELGNAYEYLLSIMSSQGDAGQFRTPRHIIDFIVDVLNPTKDDKVLDPACGTGGFLVSTYNHILEQHDGKNDPKKKEKPLTPDERKKLMANLEGYDIDPTMVRIAQVNMYLHQFKNPQIFQYDSLTSEDRWNDKFDIILANPPFMSPKGGIKPHNKFGLASNRSEVLFVDYIVSHLRPKGRAGIIVPEGIIFQSGVAYKALRKNLVENGLYAVVSLPGGVFQPYSGVKTSILLFNNELAKQKSEIAFVKISADGFDLGASKRIVTQNDLPASLAALQSWEKGDVVKSPIFTLVTKDEIASNGDYNLSGDRYKVGILSLNSTWGRVSLKEAITLNFGERITKKNESGDKYPVYGGGGESFRTDNFNRQDELIIARFAMGANCVRQVTGQFWLMDSGASYSVNQEYQDRLLKKFVDHILLNIQEEIYNCARGGAQKNLYLEMFYELEIPIPSLDVQEQIVEELNGYAAIISGAKQIVENWKPRIEVDPEWPQYSLGQLVSIDKQQANHEGLPFVGLEDIESNSGRFLGKLQPKKVKSSTYRFDSRHVLYGQLRPYLNKYLLPNFEGHCSTEIQPLLPSKELHREFLGAWLASNCDAINATSFGARMPRAKMAQVFEMDIKMPDLSEQNRLVMQIREESIQVESARKLIETYEARTQAVIAKLWSTD
jgi:type I restriction enzyme M protein